MASRFTYRKCGLELKINPPTVSFLTAFSAMSQHQTVAELLAGSAPFAVCQERGLPQYHPHLVPGFLVKEQIPVCFHSDCDVAKDLDPVVLLTRSKTSWRQFVM